ncbi:MAG: hypothetical protein P1V21_27120 [Rhizobiaceae bacterium]|nr:hypothetical protein [Rhizobiaceae bacterium]
MAKERVLIAVKTYPTLSRKYTELVCTAGFREDGSWIRIYPSPFRFLTDGQRYKKYQWIELDLAKNAKDPRPESYNPVNIDDIALGDAVGTEQDWAHRKKLICEPNIIHTNLETIIAGAKSNKFSLAIFKPTEITGFIIEASEPDWEMGKLEAAKAALDQGSLFDESKSDDFKIMPKLPFKFKYRFVDDAGKVSNMMIEDWEIGQLYWNCLKDSTPREAAKKVRQKYLDDFAHTKDLHLFLGTTRRWHVSAPNPYVIIGTFHPPITNQLSLL